MCFSGFTILTEVMPREVQERLQNMVHMKEKYYCPWKTVPRIIGTMCLKHVWLCSQQGVTCCPVLECVFSRWPAPGGETTLAGSLPPGSSASGSHHLPQGQPNHFISVFYKSTLSTFSNRSGNDVFIVLPSLSDTTSRQFSRVPLFKALLCVLDEERKVFLKISLVFYENV